MYSDRALAGKGLHYVFLGEIVKILGIFLIWIPLLGAVLTLAGLIIGLYGYVTAAKSDSGYSNVVICQVIRLVLSFISGIAAEGSLLDALFSITSDILSLAIIYFMCQTTARLVQDLDPFLAARADQLWKLYAVCMVVLVICSIVIFIPILNIIAALIAVITMILSLVAELVYLIFLYQAQKVLRGV